jgi:hypothetical protein
MDDRREHVALVVIALGVSGHEVLNGVVRVTGPGDDVVEIESVSEASIAVEASTAMERGQISAQGWREGPTTCAEKVRP